MSGERWDVVIVGGGPAGATAAALLALQGVRVLVLEKEQFPRFHIGESLLPATGHAQAVLRVQPRDDTFVFKGGAQFVCEASGRNARFDFAEALPGPPRHAYHVDRARFDALLLERAASLGARVRHGVRATRIACGREAAEVHTEREVLRARFAIDASGQDRLLARQERSIEPYRNFGKAASFTHFEPISRAAQQEFLPDNQIRVMLIERGWAWVIPLPGERLSVGVVSREPGMAQDDVLAYVASSPLLTRWTAGAKPSACRLIGNFSYRNSRSRGPRYACIGDAASFLDPVFSSGVSLAMLGAEQLAAQLTPALAAGTEAELPLADESMQRAYDTFAAFIYRFYNTRFVDNVIFGAPDNGELRAEVTSVLAGDVLRHDNPFQNMLLASRLNRAHDEPRDEAAPEW